ncbi:albusnodin/ikarugamycin family macrolactam cyclase [Nocardiopsis sp. RSe5-2]|uniref:asparagine synthase (glutamine-hydrolyzing) n=1 Tax=Nocardiopsis endophytica TaxID=3018445 RepID=A0ABT4TXX7_9ACTN|nr:albusnodin/ikarugamycin family macrolactam cyclase [Nocardiopsis endophytica]MDA2809548.1 albusnodin/ikarugamycin family macrolactam cyclase [Nocardiopsis endophytica]
MGEGTLRIAVVGDCYVKDAVLAAASAAFDRDDWAALTRWPGSYWVIAHRPGRTVVVGDAVGARPVYWSSTRDGVVWSTSARCLARKTGAEVDYTALAALLTCPLVPEVIVGRSAFTGVNRLRPGTVLVIERQGASVVAYENETAVVDFGEAVDEFRDALSEAVEVRVREGGTVTCDLSGGLDSTTVTALATRFTDKVVALTRVGPADRSDDFDYARHAAEELDGLVHETVGMGRFFDHLETAPVTDQPCTDAPRWAIHQEAARRSSEVAAKAHLTGSGADTLLSPPPFSLAELWRLRRRRDFAAHVSAYARLRHLSVHSVARSAVRLARTSYGEGLRLLADQVEGADAGRGPKRGAASRFTWTGGTGAAALLTPSARREVAERLRTAAETTRVPRAEVAQRRAWTEAREYGAYQAELTTLQRAIGLPVHAPFLDGRVVRAALSIPSHQRADLRAQKPLLCAAMAGTVPQAVLQRTTKGAYDGIALAGLRANAPRLRAILTDSRLEQNGVVEGAAARAELDRLAAGAPGRFAALEAVIAFEMWIRGVENGSGGAHCG